MTPAQQAAVLAWQGLSKDDRKAFTRLVRYARADEDVTAEDAAARDIAIALLRAFAEPVAVAMRCSCDREQRDSACMVHPSCAECGEPTDLLVQSCADHAPAVPVAPICPQCSGLRWVFHGHPQRCSPCPDCARATGGGK